MLDKPSTFLPRFFPPQCQPYACEGPTIGLLKLGSHVERRITLLEVDKQYKQTECRGYYGAVLRWVFTTKSISSCGIFG